MIVGFLSGRRFIAQFLSFSSFLSLLTEVLKEQLLELLLPRIRRRQANVVFPDKRTDAGKGMFGTNVGIGMATGIRLFFAVQRMERGVEGVGSDAHGFKCSF
jgi:hypothetical protein